MSYQPMTANTTQRDPFAVPMVFFRIGWMDRYQGISSDDKISGGGAYITEHGFGHEIFNYQPFRGRLMGYVQPPSRKGAWSEAKINLSRLGASHHDDSVSGILVVWIATAPQGGGYVVGWYRNATIYRAWQPPPPGSSRRYSNEDCGYFVAASAEDAVLLPPDERVLLIPQQGKGGMGQSNIWYADDPSIHRDLRLTVLQYIESRRLPPAESESTAHQPDPLLRQQVERNAVETTTSYFTSLGYSVTSVEQDNVGWDLNAVLDRRELKLEVKGLSGTRVVVELTPNEYRAMRQHRDSFRLCVVTNALDTPRLEIFAYSAEANNWQTADRHVLSVQEVVAARCTAP